VKKHVQNKNMERISKNVKKQLIKYRPKTTSSTSIIANNNNNSNNAPSTSINNTTRHPRAKSFKGVNVNAFENEFDEYDFNDNGDNVVNNDENNNINTNNLQEGNTVNKNNSKSSVNETITSCPEGFSYLTYY
jgi:hypothetical protein